MVVPGVGLNTISLPPPPLPPLSLSSSSSVFVWGYQHLFTYLSSFITFHNDVRRGLFFFFFFFLLILLLLLLYREYRSAHPAGSGVNAGRWWVWGERGESAVWCSVALWCRFYGEQGSHILRPPQAHCARTHTHTRSLSLCLECSLEHLLLLSVSLTPLSAL